MVREIAPARRERAASVSHGPVTSESVKHTVCIIQ